LGVPVSLVAMPSRPTKKEEDDFWGGSSDDETGAAHLDREWKARETNFFSSGYREGLEQGKHHTVQRGFNEGFADGTTQGFEWGKARGALSALHALAGQLPGTSDAGEIADIAEHNARCCRRLGFALMHARAQGYS
jgi:flagellar biosynthesis/type III secretory pathway protein FliH